MSKKISNTLQKFSAPLTKAIFVIAGLGSLSGSPQQKTLASYRQAIPQVRSTIHLWEDIERTPLITSDLDDKATIILDGHSLGGYASILAASDWMRKHYRVHLILRDPVTGGVNLPPWAQLGAPPLSLPANVLTASCYLRTNAVGTLPWHQTLAHEDGVRFRNIQVPNSDHNSLVTIIQPEVLGLAELLLGTGNL